MTERQNKRLSSKNSSNTPDKKSFLWTQERTYSIFIRDKNGKTLQRWKDINKEYADKKFKELSKRYSFLKVSLHVDVLDECKDCDATGLWNVNKEFTCPKCTGRGFTISDKVGVKLKTN